MEAEDIDLAWIRKITGWDPAARVDELMGRRRTYHQDKDGRVIIERRKKKCPMCGKMMLDKNSRCSKCYKRTVETAYGKLAHMSPVPDPRRSVWHHSL